ncbi:MAG: HEPN domain-containing protein [Microgenomates group bacterium Gr01-1014_16]|nr:MAG: HEPN domain-containing protein [Microgenomates group bacterium Gr01-1014_16]
MKDEAKIWLEQAEDSLKDAEYLYTGSRYSMAVYCCHQALEKILKACIIQFANQLPPKSHNLDALARQTTLEFPDSWLEDLAEITHHFWRVRYPDFQKFVYTSKESVKPTYDKTKEVFIWIKQHLPQI